mgnify:CR=1 FL=1
MGEIFGRDQVYMRGAMRASSTSKLDPAAGSGYANNMPPHRHSSALWVFELATSHASGGGPIAYGACFRVYNPSCDRYLAVAPALAASSSAGILAVRAHLVQRPSAASLFQAAPLSGDHGKGSHGGSGGGGGGGGHGLVSLPSYDRCMVAGDGFKLLCDGKWWLGLASGIVRSPGMPAHATPAWTRSQEVVEAAAQRMWLWRSKEKATCFSATRALTSQEVGVAYATRALAELRCFVQQTYEAARGVTYVAV